eukprot:GHVS01000672.1.p1 GENE.GHVS01000672.1~~GHVS01000672.1.p1  ORF type:complete len:141 (+),score=7.01 GHVS01000672.1:635-1057(+)
MHHKRQPPDCNRFTRNLSTSTTPPPAHPSVPETPTHSQSPAPFSSASFGASIACNVSFSWSYSDTGTILRRILVLSLHRLQFVFQIERRLLCHNWSLFVFGSYIDGRRPLAIVGTCRRRGIDGSFPVDFDIVLLSLQFLP